MDIFWLFAFCSLGAVTGFFAGLFGIGGGGIMVPVLTFIFMQLAFPSEHIVHMALATSMAAIVPTAIASFRAHHARAAVLWPVVFRITPGILVGTFAGTFLSTYLPATILAIFFSLFMAIIAVQLLLNAKPKPSRQLPRALMLTTTGSAIGAVSALVAIGGGTMTVPFLVWCNVVLPVAIGTSAAVGLPIALSGALGYAMNGWSVAGLPSHTLGFIYWPAVLAMATASFFTAPVGVSFAHSLPISRLKKYFALLQILLSAHMLYMIFWH